MGDISDSERDRYVKELTRHCGDGRLTLDELEERVGEVFAATTRAELKHALRELPRFRDDAAERTETRTRTRPAAPAPGPVATAPARRTRPAPAHRRGPVCVGKPPAVFLTLAIVMVLTAHWVLAAVFFMIALPKLNRTYRFS
jgi:hypothetical protein